MTDTVERLRERMRNCPIGSSDALLLGDAYTEIERLRKDAKNARYYRNKSGRDQHSGIEALKAEIEQLEHMKANLHGHIKRLEDENTKLRVKLEHLVDARDVWGELNWHDCFMESQKERCRLNVENAKLREALERLAAFEGKAGGVVSHMAAIARAALQKGEGE